MPGMRVFGRRWGVASDDLVFPGSFEFFVRAIWWIVMLVLYTGQRSELSHCEGGATLSTFLLGNIIILLAVLLLLACIVYTSMQGTICNHYKRRHMVSLVYVRTLLYMPELVWTLLGSTWSVRLRSVADCGDEALTAMKGAVATSWIIMLITLVMVALAFDPLGGHSETRGGDVGGGNADPVQLLRSARRVWETRVRLMCCWLRDEEHGGAFSEIARVLSDFFLDTDLVASDIAAGLSLLHQKQDRQGPREIVTEGPLSLIVHPESMSVELDSAARYAKFAWAAYGWPMYVLQNPISGLSMFFKNCSCRHGEQQSAEYSLVGGDGDGGEGRNMAAVLRVTGLRRGDITYVSFHNAVFQIPFFVALDHDTQAVVVSVRGTLSLRDILTNLSADSGSMQVVGVEQDCYAHKGMIQAAEFIHHRLVNDGILAEAFQQARDYRLVVTGHSMGGGVAVLLSILLRPTYPQLRCYAFSPPGGLLSQTLAHHTHEFVLSVVVGKDVVPRLSLSNMEDLKQSILQIIAASNRPKYQILLLGCCYEVCGVNPSSDEEEEEEVQRTSLLQPLLSTGDLSEDQQPMVYTAWVPPPNFTLSLAPSSGLDSAAEPSVSLPVEASLITQQRPLFLPGRILHIVDDDDERGVLAGRGCIAGRARRFRVRWEDPATFRSLLISPRMFSDHTPHAIAHALCQLAGPATPDHRSTAPSCVA